MINNLCRKILTEGGRIYPLIIPSEHTGGTGIMNPSVFIDGDDLLINLRHVNYTLYHCEGQQLFNNRHGPLSYLNPENDIKLRTTNFLCKLKKDFVIDIVHKIDTSKLDIPPVWEFIGLEDARLVRWDNRLYICGVRRDVKTNGEGRMELSEIILDDGKVSEVSRFRIPPPKNKQSYCEKNWMPIIDMPYHFIKWTNVTEVVMVNPLLELSESVFTGTKFVPYLPDFRGSSQVIPWKEFRICIVHEVNLFKNRQVQKDAKYLHRFIVWDKDWNIVKLSDSFSFMDGEVEFCCGMAFNGKDFLITFGFQDNAAFLLKVPESSIEKVLYDNENIFDWGATASDLVGQFNYEIFILKIYEKSCEVKEGDVVVDIGASAGAFTYSILKKKPKRVYCIEPSGSLFPTLVENTKGDNVTQIRAAIFDKDTAENVRVYSDDGTPYPVMTFREFIDIHAIDDIDFMKVDCEGGEVNIFSEENRDYIINHVKHSVIEWHIWDIPDAVNKFKKFRDSYLVGHGNFKATTESGEDLSLKIFDDAFIENFLTIYNFSTQIMVYVTNK